MAKGSITFSLVDYMKYFGDNVNSRCVVEGEEVLNAGHIILHGQTESSPTSIKLCAVCLQTSALQSDPHQITGELNITKGHAKIIRMHCSCKAGAGGRCKHISAFLILLTRKNLLELEEISKTQLACAWINNKGSVRDKYKAVCIQEMPCIKPKIVRNVLNASEELRNSMFQYFIDKLPNSAIGKHRKGRHIAAENNNTESAPSQSTPRNTLMQKVIDHSAQSILMMDIFSDVYSFPHPCCKVLYDSIMNEDLFEMMNLHQNSLEWYHARTFRITGSRCYEIYTYQGSNWEIKSQKYFWPKSFSNKFVKHGLKYESQAREAFISQTGHIVIECGMVIFPQNKWLGFSPDGVVTDGNGNPIGLLEMKCLYAGATSTIEEAASSSAFLHKENGEYQLKQKHKYYGQVQLGMCMLNVPICFLVLFASLDNSS